MGGIFNAAKSLVTGDASSMTPQNSYQYNTGGQDLNSLLSGTQAQTANIQGQQNNLGQQLLAQSQGQGPNPAQLQLKQATDENNKMAAGAAASQKGINPGLGLKQVLSNQAAANQKSAGQGAVLGAQQQLAAQSQLGGLYSNMATQNLANQGQYEGILGGANTVASGVANQNATALQNSQAGLMNAYSAGLGNLSSLTGGGAAGGSTAAAGGLSAGSSLGSAAMLAYSGAEIPGAAPIKGDSPQNDIVTAKVSPKEIVLPRSVTMSKNPGDAAKDFVEQLKGIKSNKKSSYADVLAAKRKAKAS